MKQLFKLRWTYRQILGWKLGFQTIRKIQTPIMLKMLSFRDGEYILDAGCGSGNISCEMGRGPKIVALDVSSNNIKETKSKFNYLGFDGCSIIGSVTHLPLRSNIFDKALLSSVLQHIKNPIIVLKDIHRVLKKTGVFVINVPSDRPYLYLPLVFKDKYSCIENVLLRNFNMIHKYSIYEMKNKLEHTGFKIISLEYSPKYVAAFFYEVNLLLMMLNAPKWRMVRRLLFIATPMIFILSKLDYMLPRKTQGSEFIIKTKVCS